MKISSIRSPGGFTLLEVILAMGLGAVLLMAVGLAIDVHTRALDVGRTEIEQAQLARALFSRISQDLRTAVLHTEVDLSKYSVPASKSSTSGDGSGDSSGTGSKDSSGSGSSGDNSPSSTPGIKNIGPNEGVKSVGGKGSTPTPSPTPGKSEGASGSSAGSSSGFGTSSGSSGATSTSFGGAASGSGQDSSGNASSNSSSSTDTTDHTQNIADATELPSTPGLYGNDHELMIDVLRPVPRADQIQSALNPDVDPTTTAPLSTLKTITYFLGQGGGDAAAAPGGNGGGLMRRDWDRQAAACASQNGNLTDLASDQEPLAPEVTDLQFRYYDGTDWVDTWDSSQNSSLPLAVQVVLGIARPQRPQGYAGRMIEGITGNSADQTRIYRITIALPTGQPPVDQSSTDSSSPSQNNNGNSGSSGSN